MYVHFFRDIGTFDLDIITQVISLLFWITTRKLALNRDEIFNVDL